MSGIFGGVVRLVRLASSAGASLVGFIQSGTGAVLRSIQQELGIRFTPLQFGAVGDGVADDTAAVVNAIKSNRDVFLPPGYIFSVSGATITGQTNFRVFGRGKLLLRNASNKPVIEFDACSQFDATGLWVDGNAAGQTEAVNRNLGAGISVADCTGWKVTRCTVENNYSGAAILAIDNGATTTELPTNGEISFNIIKNAGKVAGALLSDGIYANSDNTLVIGNIIDTVTDYGIAGDYSHKLSIKDNVINNAALVGIGILGAYNWQVSGNTIDGAGQGVSVTLSGNAAISPYVSNGAKIHDNTILNITRAGSGTPNGDGIFVDPSATGVSIMGNTVKNAYRGIACDAPDAMVIGNTVDTTTDRGIYNAGTGSVSGLNKVKNAGAANYYGATIDDKMIVADGFNEGAAISAFSNTWANKGAPYKVAGFYRQGGRVHLYGAITKAAPVAGQPAFQLPIYYRPGETVSFLVADDTGTGVWSVDVNGYVIYRSGTGVAVNLDGISFVAA